MLKEVGKTVVLACLSTKAAWITWMGTGSPPSHSDPKRSKLCVCGGGWTETFPPIHKQSSCCPASQRRGADGRGPFLSGLLGQVLAQRFAFV